MLELIAEAEAAGSRLAPACEILGLGVRTVQRWRKQPGGGKDDRKGPHSAPSTKYSAFELEVMERTMNSPEYRDLPPSQIVPRLADQGRYVGSESTMYRFLREQKQLAHRESSRPRRHRRPQEYEATGPNQVWSWDITYLLSPVKGRFYYLYLFVDVWSRKIVGGEVYEEECNEIAARLFRRICRENQLDPKDLVLHSDNGGPMKGSTLRATLERLEVVQSFSRPRVHDDNPYSEALFRTLKYRPGYPEGPFDGLGHARLWVRSFIGWYNHEHLHSAISFVAPADRHEQKDEDILEARRRVYEEARRRHPERFASGVRKWDREDVVRLNPAPSNKRKLPIAA